MKSLSKKRQQDKKIRMINYRPNIIEKIGSKKPYKFEIIKNSLH